MRVLGDNVLKHANLVARTGISGMAWLMRGDRSVVLGLSTARTVLSSWQDSTAFALLFPQEPGKVNACKEPQKQECMGCLCKFFGNGRHVP